jgi:uncharacterized repeat protein (TIGR02543 family)
MSSKSNRLTAVIGLATSAVLAISTLFAPTAAFAASFTVTCTETVGAPATPFSLEVNNGDDEVVQATAKNCGGALTIPEGARKIGFGAFVPWDAQNRPLSNSYITSISLPSTLQTIWVGGLINLTSVSQLVIPASVTTIESQALQGMSSLQTVRIEGSSSSTPTTIGYNALGLTHPELDLVFGAGKVVLLMNFGASSQIRTLDLGSGMLSIGPYAFYEQRFSDLTIPPSVTTISEQAFGSMPNLSEIKFGATTPGLTSIHAAAFANTNITSVQYCGGNTVLDNYLTANLPNADVYCDASVIPEAPTIAGIAPGGNSVLMSVVRGAENDGAAPRNYSIEYSSDATTWTTYTPNPPSSSTLITVPYLTNEVAYSFRVAAINPAGASSYSAASSLVTPRAPRFGISYAAGDGFGTAPVDTNVYLPGESAVLKPVSSLQKTNFTFIGWDDGQSVHQPNTSYPVGAGNVTLTAKWIQNSLYGIDPNDLTRLGSLTASGIDTLISGTSGGSRVTVTYLTGGLPTGTIINVDLLANSARARSLISTADNFLLSFVVSWLAPDGTVPVTAAGKPITMTIANDLIKKGASAYSLIGGIATVLGTATADGFVTISITEDPEIAIANINPNASNSTPSYIGPMVTSGKQQVRAGETVSLTGANLGLVEKVLISGVEAEIVSKSSTGITLRLRSSMSAGLYGIIMNSSFGALNVLEHIEVLPALQTSTPTPPRASKVVSSQSIYFGGNSAALSMSAKNYLKQVASRFAGKKNTLIVVRGFVLGTRITKNDAKLSLMRAQTTIDYLKSQGLKVVFKAVAAGVDKTSSAKARRAQVTVVSG